MEIKEVKGRHFKGDKIVNFKTNDGDWESISIRKILLLINRITLNECKKYRCALDNGGELWFEGSIKDVLKVSKEGKDLFEEENLFEILCKKWKIPIEKIKQTKLGDYKI